MKNVILFLLFLALASLSQGIAQEQTITGKITTQEYYGIAAVSVSVKNTASAIVANAKGEYTIKVPKNSILVFEAVGFETREVAVTNQKVLNVTLEREALMLEEVKIEVEPEKLEPAKPPKPTITIDRNIVPSPVKPFEPERDMVEINPLTTPKITLKIGQKAYYKATVHGSVGIWVGVTSEDSEVFEEVDTHFAYQKIQLRGMTGGDKATKTYIFEAKKIGKTKVIIKKNFRGKVTDIYSIKIIVK